MSIHTIKAKPVVGRDILVDDYIFYRGKWKPVDKIEKFVDCVILDVDNGYVKLDSRSNILVKRIES